jgi:hypothetical protein
MRWMATAIDAYYIDEKAYPAWSAEAGENYFVPLERKQDQAVFAQLPTFMAPGPGRAIHTLTTPLAYITNYLSDSFSPIRNQIFCYWVPPGPVPGWIIWSLGPDGNYDLTMANIAQAYDSTKTAPSPPLLSLTYDPTNGPTSKGDIWRIKQ